MIGQRRPTLAPPPGPLGLQRRVALFLLGLDLGRSALQILEAKLELVGIEHLGAPAELQPPQLGDDVVEPLGPRRQPRDLVLEPGRLGLKACRFGVDPQPLRSLDDNERAECRDVVRQGFGCRLHAASRAKAAIAECVSGSPD